MIKFKHHTTLIAFLLITLVFLILFSIKKNQPTQNKPKFEIQTTPKVSTIPIIEPSKECKSKLCPKLKKGFYIIADHEQGVEWNYQIRVTPFDGIGAQTIKCESGSNEEGAPPEDPPQDLEKVVSWPFQCDWFYFDDGTFLIVDCLLTHSDVAETCFLRLFNSHGIEQNDFQPPFAKSFSQLRDNKIEHDILSIKNIKIHEPSQIEIHGLFQSEFIDGIKKKDRIVDCSDGCAGEIGPYAEAKILIDRSGKILKKDIIKQYEY